MELIKRLDLTTRNHLFDETEVNREGYTIVVSQCFFGVDGSTEDGSGTVVRDTFPEREECGCVVDSGSTGPGPGTGIGFVVFDSTSHRGRRRGYHRIPPHVNLVIDP